MSITGQQKVVSLVFVQGLTKQELHKNEDKKGLWWVEPIILLMSLGM